MKILLRSMVCIMMVCFLGSWGFLVHKTAHQLAVYELPRSIQYFFYNNIDTLVANAIRPDLRRSYNKTEGPKHFIDLEAYGDSASLKMPLTWDSAIAKYSKDTLFKYGYVPYVVMDIKNKLTNAFKNKNADSILFYAADIGHYIEDANVPLHTTINHNGQLTNQKGLHALWESTVPSVEIADYNLYTQHKATYLSNPSLSIWTAIREAHALLPSLLSAEKNAAQKFSGEKYVTEMRFGKSTQVYSNAFAKQYAQELKPTVNEQLIKSANLVADFWYTAWKDAGSPSLSTITAKFTPTQKQKRKKEIKAFKKNQLAKDKLLRVSTKDNL